MVLRVSRRPCLPLIGRPGRHSSAGLRTCIEPTNCPARRTPGLAYRQRMTFFLKKPVPTSRDPCTTAPGSRSSPPLQDRRCRIFGVARDEILDPSFYGAQTYDAVGLINSAVRAVQRNLHEKEGLRKAMEKADFKSVRSNFK